MTLSPITINPKEKNLGGCLHVTILDPANPNGTGFFFNVGNMMKRFIIVNASPTTGNFAGIRLPRADRGTLMTGASFMFLSRPYSQKPIYFFDHDYTALTNLQPNKGIIFQAYRRSDAEGLQSEIDNVFVDRQYIWRWRIIGDYLIHTTFTTSSTTGITLSSSSTMGTGTLSGTDSTKTVTRTDGKCITSATGGGGGGGAIYRHPYIEAGL